MANFGPILLVNPFAKMSVFRLFKLYFYRLQRRFFDVEYRKRHFPSRYCVKKKKLEKAPFLDQNHGLIPLKKCQFFEFLKFLFL